MKYFVSRHNGAIEWAKRHGIEVDQLVAHFEPAIIQDGDVVIGTLPINIVAEVNRRGGEYLHLSMTMPAEARGQELTADDMESFGASLEKFSVATDAFCDTRISVGEWDEEEGDYMDNGEDYEIRAHITFQGAVLKLKTPGCDERDVYIERIPGSWRLNLSLDAEEIVDQIEMTDVGEIV